MSFRKGYNTVRFTKLPAGDRSVNAVFGSYAGNPYVGLIFSFDRPMQYLLLHGHRTVGNLKTLEFGRSYMIYTSRAFTIDTTYWVEPGGAPRNGPPLDEIPRQGFALSRNKKPAGESGGFLYRTFFPLHSDTSTLRHLRTSSRPVAGFLFPGLAEAPAAIPPPSAGRALPGHTDDRGSSPGWR